MEVRVDTSRMVEDGGVPVVVTWRGWYWRTSDCRRRGSSSSGIIVVPVVIFFK